jgi:hypothetical protein
MKVRA